MALRYWTGNATPTSFNWNYNSGGITNWGSASGVADNVLPPTSSDDVIFDGAGAKGNSNSTVSAGVTILSITFTSGYTGVIGFTGNFLTIGGNFTDNPAHTWNMLSTNFITFTGNQTITSNGAIFPGSISFTSGVSTKTLNGSWTILGTLTIGSLAATTLNRTNLTDTLSANGLPQINSTLSGTAKIRVTGGILTNGGTSPISNNLDLDGNITITGNLTYNTGTLTYISGTITTANLIIGSGCTLDTNGMTWNSISATNTSSIVINSLLSVTSLSVSQIIFSGTHGFMVANFIRTQGASSPNTVTFKNSLTYTITNSLAVLNTANLLNVNFVSDSATLRANLILRTGATCNVCARFTRIDATGGRPINTWNSTVTDCINVRSFTDLRTVVTSIN
jgi:hypothetical protein